MTQNTVAAFKCKRYHKLLFLTYQTNQFSNALSYRRLLLILGILEVSSITRKFKTSKTGLEGKKMHTLGGRLGWDHQILKGIIF